MGTCAASGAKPATQGAALLYRPCGRAASPTCPGPNQVLQARLSSSSCKQVQEIVWNQLPWSHCMQVPVGLLVQHMLRKPPPISDIRITRGHITSFTPRHLTNTLWALARLGLHSGALYNAAAIQLLYHHDAIADKGLAELVTTFAQPPVQAVSCAFRAVLRMAALETQKRVQRGSFVPNALAEVFWGLWKVHLRNGETKVGGLAARVLRAGAGRKEVALRHERLDMDKESEALDAIEGDMVKEKVLNVSISEANLADKVPQLVLSLANLTEQVRSWSCAVYVLCSAF
jgi:hypothetical protein